MLTQTVTRVRSHARILTDDKLRSHDTAWTCAVWSVHGSIFLSVLLGSETHFHFEVVCGQYGNHKLTPANAASGEAVQQCLVKEQLQLRNLSAVAAEIFADAVDEVCPFRWPKGKAGKLLRVMAVATT